MQNSLVPYYNDPELERQQLEEELALLEELEKERIEKAFIPENPEAKPFFLQELFFKSTALTQLLRCGNRAAKTFSWVRDRAWKLMRNHPYKKNWNHDYNSSSPKLFWMVGPTFEFCTQVVWEQYLSKMIPKWYWTDDYGKPMIDYIEKGLIDKVRFRNGDMIEFKTYSQSLLSKMGRKIDDLAVDEMPPHLKILTELIVRVLDQGGEATYAFTPVNPNKEIKEYLDGHPTIELHTWSVLDNPVYHDPAKRERLLAEYEKLSKEERDTRLNGEWYVEPPTEDRLMTGVEPEIVDDFPIPLHWRQCRFADPAAHRTGVVFFAEDPNTNDWYVHKAMELEWGNQAATADMLKAQINLHRPYEGFRYCLSVYDNHELWFQAHGPREDWQPCVQKNREAAIVQARNLINAGKIKFMKRGAMPLIMQMSLVKMGGKYKDHMLDCLLYFARQVPAPKKIVSLSQDEHSLIYNRCLAERELEAKSQQRVSRTRFATRKFQPMRRGVR